MHPHVWFHRRLKALPARWAVLALCLALVACATVPMTERKQLSLMSNQELSGLGLKEYQKVLQQAKLSQDQAKVAMVRRVGRDVASAAERFMDQRGLGQEKSYYQWEFNLIDDDKTINAWCMPGGKIAVYTGILPLSQNDNGLAVIIGHEVAHALAKHGNERMSQALLVNMGGIALAVALSQKPAQTRNLFLAAFGVGTAVGILLPYSRVQEYEADRIGLTLTAMAGYDPREAVPFWQRMRAKGGSKTPEFLSTHPAPDNRIDQIKAFLPEAMQHHRPR